MSGHLTMEVKNDSEISLFSLELVVEKVYIPHTPCRFPAIAFRLLDFPTIVIKHVEDDLAKAIRGKISFDPYYSLPDQFIELKDRHGNFMVKKGKSCLFKISAYSLKQHLASTPLYVMVIDLFPEVPKLIGNSSVPLNSLMESICVDIAKLGSTVPSVHGDKGLYKLYNLMGKEIGYFVLGFRLLCLGPSLIAHLPDTALLHHEQKVQEDQTVEHMITKHHNSLLSKKRTIDIPDPKQKTSSSMTEPLKQDAFLQTVEMKDKEILVNLYESESSIVKVVSTNESHNVTTQTDKQKRRKEHQRDISIPKWVEQIENENDDNNLIINNIICPPPMFYNSEASPALIVKRNISKVLYDSESPAYDLSEIESYDGYGLHKEKLPKEKIIKHGTSTNIQTVKFQPSTTSKVLEPAIPRARPGERILGLQVAPNPDAVFPLLTALLNELSSIQNPQLLLNVSNKLQAASLKSSELAKPPNKKSEIQPDDKKLSSSVVSAVAAALTRKLETSKENIERNKSEPVKKDHSPLTQFQQRQSPLKSQKPVADKENKGNNKKQALALPATKGKLIFGLTHTQRLRLQKTNPHWLKLAEKEAADLKAKTQTIKNLNEFDDMNATTFSDTLTEVRRLAEKELNSTVGGDTLLNLACELESTSENVKLQQKGVHQKSNPHLTKKTTRSEKFSEHKIDQNLISKSQQLKARNKLRQKRKLQQKELRKGSLNENNIKRQKSPLAQNTDIDDQLSILSDVLSSRSRSIEVRLPSAEPDFDETTTSMSDKGEENDDIDEEGDIPLPDDSLKEHPRSNIINFRRYVSKDVSPPESIDGVHNASLNISGTVDNNSPLESTRQSKSYTSDQNDSKILQSTEYDTRQFHSTDEPELQGLMSEEANFSDSPDSGRRSVSLVATSQKFPIINPQLSENSPVPSIRRSTTKIDPSAYSYLQSGSFSKDHNQLPSPRPLTPKGNTVKGERSEMAPFKPQGSGITTPKLKTTPRSLSSSPKHPTPRPRRPMRESIHTDSLSSYMPSDPDNVIVSLSSNSGNYSDDFLAVNSGESAASSVEQFPKIISSAKLGYTIN